MLKQLWLGGWENPLSSLHHTPTPLRISLMIFHLQLCLCDVFTSLHLQSCHHNNFVIHGITHSHSGNVLPLLSLLSLSSVLWSVLVPCTPYPSLVAGTTQFFSSIQPSTEGSLVSFQTRSSFSAWPCFEMRHRKRSVKVESSHKAEAVSSRIIRAAAP